MWDDNAVDIPEVAAIATFLCGREAQPRPFRFDSIAASIAATNLGKLAGLPEGWDLCPVCHGEGEVEAATGTP